TRAIRHIVTSGQHLYTSSSARVEPSSSSSSSFASNSNASSSSAGVQQSTGSSSQNGACSAVDQQLNDNGNDLPAAAGMPIPAAASGNSSKLSLNDRWDVCPETD